LGIAVAMWLGTMAADAAADKWRPDQGPHEGIGFGAAIGRGSIEIECDICDGVDPITEGVSLSLWGGHMINPRLMVLGEYWTVRYNGRGSDWFVDTSREQYVAQHMVLGGAQLWLSTNFYVRASLGAGWHVSDSRYADLDRPPTPPGPNALPALAPNDPAPRYTPASSFGIGAEIAHTRTFAAEVLVRVGTTRRPSDEYQVTNVALTFGASWY
jgi:hypothetical protein